MKQNKISESTKKATDKSLELTRSAIEKSQRATEKTLELTRSVVEQSKKLRTPSIKVDKIGTAVGGLVGAGLLFGGVVQVFVGKPLWGLGTLSISAVTLLSNRSHHQQIKSRE